MKLDPRQYDEMVSRASPPSPVVRDCAWAFLVGGAICTLGEALRQFFLIWYDKTLAGTLTSIALIFLSAIFTLPGWYQKLAAKAGAGTLVPITGFANAVASPAIEFKTDVRCIIRIVRETRNRRVSGLNPTKYAGKEVLEAAIIPHDFSLPQSQMDVADPSGSFYFPILL